jgi:succinate dehydrogenase/fumarate reductase flavoprotein subunit
MSHVQRALVPSSRNLDETDKISGIRPIWDDLADARLAWEDEDRRDLEEAAELAMFEWRLSITEIGPAAPDPPPIEDSAEPFAPGAAEVDAWFVERARRAQVRRAGRWLFAGAFAGMLGIAANRAGGDAIASWLTFGHRAEARAAVSLALHHVAAW